MGDELKNKTHGDIVSILLKLERMFKFKIMCSLNKKDIKKLDFSQKKPTRALPEWWREKWDHCIVEGTLECGWGAVHGQFATEKYQFTTNYKGKPKQPKKDKKTENKEINDISDGIEQVKIDLIEKKREWIPSGKKQEAILISICNHFRKEIREKFKKVTSKIKKKKKKKKNFTKKKKKKKKKKK